MSCVFVFSCIARNLPARILFFSLNKGNAARTATGCVCDLSVVKSTGRTDTTTALPGLLCFSSQQLDQLNLQSAPCILRIVASVVVSEMRYCSLYEESSLHWPALQFNG